jgi:hypothetical protein
MEPRTLDTESLLPLERFEICLSVLERRGNGDNEPHAGCWS